MKLIVEKTTSDESELSLDKQFIKQELKRIKQLVNSKKQEYKVVAKVHTEDFEDEDEDYNVIEVEAVIITVGRESQDPLQVIVYCVKTDDKSNYVIKTDFDFEEFYELEDFYDELDTILDSTFEDFI